MPICELKVVNYNEDGGTRTRCSLEGKASVRDLEYLLAAAIQACLQGVGEQLEAVGSAEELKVFESFNNAAILAFERMKGEQDE